MEMCWILLNKFIRKQVSHKLTDIKYGSMAAAALEKKMIILKFLNKMRNNSDTVNK